MAMVRLQTNCHEKDLLDIRKSSENPIHEILIGMNTFAATFAGSIPPFLRSAEVSSCLLEDVQGIQRQADDRIPGG